MAGEKFLDPSRTGVLQPGDAGLSGVTIQLVDASNGAVLQSTTTDSQGRYSFGPLTPGRYTVREVVNRPGPRTSRQPGSDIVLLNAGTTMVNFGDPSEGSIAGVVDQDPSYEGTDDTPLPGVTVFLDTNGNGVLDPGEPTAYSMPRGSTRSATSWRVPTRWASCRRPGLAPAPDRSVTLATDQDATGVNLVMTPQLTGGPPAAILLATSGQPDRQSQHDFGTMLADGPGNAQGVLELDLANYGGQPLTVTGVTFTVRDRRLLGDRSVGGEDGATGGRDRRALPRCRSPSSSIRPRPDPSPPR